jgi:hypothetical protein
MKHWNIIECENMDPNKEKSGLKENSLQDKKNLSKGQSIWTTIQIYSEY